MKKIILIILIAALFLTCGCAKRLNTDIDENSIKITSRNNNEYINPNNSGDGYCYVEIGGTKYLPFGTQNKRLTGDIIGRCIAYEDIDNNQRYFEVIGYSDFIAAFYNGGIMEQWDFFRREDTIGKETEIPDFIFDLGYEIWK